MGDLTIESEELMRAVNVIDEVRTRLAQAKDVARDTATMTGHAALGDRVLQFGDSWEIARAVLLAQLLSVGEGLTAVVQTFADLDQSLRLDSAENPAG